MSNTLPTIKGAVVYDVSEEVSALLRRMRDRNTAPRERLAFWWDGLTTYTVRTRDVVRRALSVGYALCECVACLSEAIVDANLFETIRSLPHPDLAGRKLAVQFLQRCVTAARHGVAVTELRRGELSKMLDSVFTDAAAQMTLTFHIRAEVLGDYGVTTDDQRALARCGYLPPPVSESVAPLTQDTPDAISAPAPSGGTTKKTKGKAIDARMLKVMAEKVDSWGWSARQWAEYLQCSDGTVKATKTWRDRLRAIRSGMAVESAERMDGTRRRSSGGKKPMHRAQA